MEVSGGSSGGDPGLFGEVASEEQAAVPATTKRLSARLRFEPCFSNMILPSVMEEVECPTSLFLVLSDSRRALI
jgi:hypothetical protein